MVITPEAVLAAVVDIMARSWEWGQVDCCTAASDVFARLNGFDPMAEARGRYATEAGAYRYLMRRGGFLQTVDGILMCGGFRVADDARPGDLALCPQAERFGAALAVCVQPGAWAAKTPNGHAILTTTKRIWTCRR